jgi:hypothetical protein
VPRRRRAAAARPRERLPTMHRSPHSAPRRARRARGAR